MQHDTPSDEGNPQIREVAYLAGRYQQCRRLLTSPRFNRSQREIIEADALEVKDRLEGYGVQFADTEDAA